VQHSIAAASLNPMGLLDWLYTAVAWVIMRIHAGLSPIFGSASGWTWGLTIVLLTVFVRLLLFPLFVKQIHAQRKMADLAPKVQEIRKKYKSDKQKMNQEVMKLYQENGANPLGGCLPLVAQFPVFIALFTVLRAIADWTPAVGKPKYGLTIAVVQSAQKAHILGVTVATRFISNARELATQGVNPVTAKVVIGLAVLLSGTTTYLTVRQSMRRNLVGGATASDNPMMQSQKMMVYVAPMFALTGLYWQFGLVMYWLTTNLWTLGQQHYIFSKYPPPTPATAGGQPGAGPAAAGGGGAKRPASPAGKGPAVAGSGGGAKRDGTGRGGTGTRGGAGTTRDGQARPGLGMLRRMRPEPEPEPPPQAEEPKVVRHQPVRQSRSKRTGKR
jgi:YidC/Oxa1 family membrane protein insertase